MTQPSTTRIVNRSQPLTAAERIERRNLMFQDSLSLVGLTAISILIAILTYFFFNSYREHRAVLEKRWYARGEQAMAAGNPLGAVQAYRSALSLSSDNSVYELSLAEALAAANRNDEAYAYFSSLHDAQPGDGYLNLQLARLEAKRKNPALAVNFYRSALTGLWYGHGAAQRFQIRLELAKYLISWGKTTEAQGDLLTAEGNSLDHPAQLFEVAVLLEQAGDPSDALEAYQRVERHGGATPAQVLQALLGEVHAAVSSGQYKRAALVLDRYDMKARQHPSAATLQQRRAAQQHLGRLRRLLQLVPFSALPTRQRAERVLAVANIAHARYTACESQLQTGSNSNLSSGDSAAMDALSTDWDEIGSINSKKLADDLPLQQTMMAWTNRTEILTAKLCGAPVGDDALLLQLATVPDKNE